MAGKCAKWGKNQPEPKIIVSNFLYHYQDSSNISSYIMVSLVWRGSLSRVKISIANRVLTQVTSPTTAEWRTISFPYTKFSWEVHMVLLGRRVCDLEKSTGDFRKTSNCSSCRVPIWYWPPPCCPERQVLSKDLEIQCRLQNPRAACANTFFLGDYHL